MDSKTYIDNALRTESRPEALGMNLGGTLRVLALLVAAADLADTFKRGVFYGKGLNREKLALEVALLQSALNDVSMILPRLHIPEDYPLELAAPNLRVLHGFIGVYGEAGEGLAAVVRQINTGQLDLTNVGEELGDQQWYQAIISDETGVSFEQTRETNIAKLKQRYAGKFSSEAATERDLVAERAVLEEGLSTDREAANDGAAEEKAA